jgi:nucleoside-diphosphate-sugar epimerase
MTGLCVIFGTGPLGCAVADELIKRGREVKMINRSGEGRVPEKVSLRKGDATDPERTRALCKDAELVFHCAMPPYTNWPEEFPALTYGIMEGARYVGASLVYADNLYAYGIVNCPITENLSYNASGPKGKTRAIMAETLMHAHKEGKLRVTIGRASDFFGPRVINSIMGSRVFVPAIENKKINIPGKLNQPHTYTYIRDFAKGLVILSENINAFGETWHIPSAETLTTQKFLNLIFKETETFPSVKTASGFIFNFISRFNPILKELKEVLPSYEQPYVVDHAKFEKAFGNCSTPHETAISETISWFKSENIK